MNAFQRSLLVGTLLLSACGFSPIYGTKGGEGSPVAESLSTISIANIPDESGQKLRNRLMDRLYFHGRPARPTAKLSVSLSEGEAELGIQKDATASLIELTLTAPYKLADMKGKALLNGEAKSIVLYSKLDAQYGTLAAERNAHDRAIHEVGEQIVNRLSLYYAEPRAKPDASVVVKPLTPKDSWALSGRKKNKD